MKKVELTRGLKRLLIGCAVIFGLYVLILMIFSALLAQAGSPNFNNFGDVFGYYSKGILDLFAFNYAHSANFLYFSLSVFLYALIVCWVILLVAGLIVNDKRKSKVMWWGIGVTFAFLFIYIFFASGTQTFWQIVNAKDVYAGKPELMFMVILMIVLALLYFIASLAVYFWSIFLIFAKTEGNEEEDDAERIRRMVREELQAAQPFKVELINGVPPVIVEKEVEPEPQPEPEPVEEVEEEDENNPARKRIPFMNRILSADMDVKTNYNEIKNEILSYGVKSRVSNSGDTFRLKRKTYVKIGIGGKSLKLFFALNPEDYKDSPMPIKDVGHKAIYGETPLLLKVKSPLSVRRAKALIADVMAKDELPQGDVGEENFVSEFRTANAEKSKKK